MKRVLVAILTALLAIGLGATVASAQKKKKAPAKKHAEAAAPVSPKIGESMGDIRWGMDKDELIKRKILEIFIEPCDAANLGLLVLSRGLGIAWNFDRSF